MQDRDLKVILEERRKRWAERDHTAAVDRGRLLEYLEHLPVLIERGSFESFVGALPDSYVRRFAPKEIIQHYLSFRHYQPGQTVTILAPLEQRWALTLLTGDHPYLLAQISGTLALYELNILEAEAFTHPEGIVLDHFLIQDGKGYLRDEQRRRKLQVSLEKDDLAGSPLKGLLARSPAGSPCQIFGQNVPELSTTLLSVECPDRIGLLFEIASAISEKNCDISSAYIETNNDRVHDIFLITRQGQPLDAPALSELTDHLTRTLGGTS